MTLLRRAGLSKPRPERSLEAAREVGADGFCLKKDILRNDSTHKTFFILKIGYGKIWAIVHSKSWKELVQRDVGADRFCLQMDILGNKFIQQLDYNQDH